MNVNLIDESIFILEKEIWDVYDMSKTRENVVEFIRNYKEARARSIQAIVFGSSSGLTNRLDPNKVFVPVRANSGGFAHNSDIKMDNETFLSNIMPSLVNLQKTFTDEEQKYYDFCILNGNSEEYLRNALNGISRTGLIPIKNSCILKIAFVFNIEVKK